MLQAKVDDLHIPKDLLYKSIHPRDREEHGERVVLGQIDWEICGDPYFYENYHLEPQVILETKKVEETWIYYNTTKFSGKRLRLQPGAEFTTQENGVYNIFAWKGRGLFEDCAIEAGKFGDDELLITHDRATKPHTVKNTGRDLLELFKFFGPDINPDCPMIEKRTP